MIFFLKGSQLNLTLILPSQLAIIMAEMYGNYVYLLKQLANLYILNH